MPLAGCLSHCEVSAYGGVRPTAGGLFPHAGPLLCRRRRHNLGLLRTSLVGRPQAFAEGQATDSAAKQLSERTAFCLLLVLEGLGLLSGEAVFLYWRWGPRLLIARPASQRLGSYRVATEVAPTGETVRGLVSSTGTSLPPQQAVKAFGNPRGHREGLVEKSWSCL